MGKKSRRLLSLITVMILLSLLAVVKPYKVNAYNIERQNQKVCHPMAKIEGIWAQDQDENDVESKNYHWKADGRRFCLASLSDEEFYKRDLRPWKAELKIENNFDKKHTNLAKRGLNVFAHNVIIKGGPNPNPTATATSAPLKVAKYKMIENIITVNPAVENNVGPDMAKLNNDKLHSTAAASAENAGSSQSNTPAAPSLSNQTMASPATIAMTFTAAVQLTQKSLGAEPSQMTPTRAAVETSSQSVQTTTSASVNIERRSPLPAGNGNSTGNGKAPVSAQPSADKPVVIFPSAAVPIPVIIKPSQGVPSTAPSAAAAASAAPSAPVPSVAPPAKQSQDPVAAQPSPDPVVMPQVSPQVVVQPSPDVVAPQPTIAPVLESAAPVQPQAPVIQAPPLAPVPSADQLITTPESQDSTRHDGSNGGRSRNGSNSRNGHSPTSTLLIQTISLAATTVAVQLNDSSDAMSIAKIPIIAVLTFVAVALAAFGLYAFIRVSKRRGWRFPQNGFRSSRPLPKGFFKPAVEY